MARVQQVVESVTCDICGKHVDDATTVSLGWGRSSWELDLCAKDLATVSTSVDKWIASGRKVRVPSRRTQRSNTDATAIRAWARDNGITVGRKGRVSAELRQAYERAHAS